MLGDRDIGQVWGALVDSRHYRALWNMRSLYPRFAENLYRYLTARGEYPYKIAVRTPAGLVEPTLFSHHDLLTVNEIFCRQDYPAGPDTRVVVDIGSNIGISALYFLSRSPSTFCYLFEPDPRNVARLVQNLSGLEHRYRLQEVAVAAVSGMVDFGVEPTGRYGGIGRRGQEVLRVPCRHINEVLSEVLEVHPRIHIVKIDTEGAEIQTVAAMERRVAERVDRIYLEARPDAAMQPEVFFWLQYGSVHQLTNRSLRG